MAILNLDMYSYELAMDTQVMIMLPERRGVPHDAHDDPYPVLYMLHGHGRDYTTWFRMTRLEFYLQNTDVIVVCPNTNRASWVDGVNTHRYGSFLTEELPRALKNWFNITTDREHTFISGMSMGGYGSLHAALAHPEKFGACCPLSAGIQMGTADVKGQVDKGLAIPDSPEIDRNFVNTFGPNDQYAGSEYDLKDLARKLNASNAPKPRILQLCGTEDPLYSQNADFAKFMQEECPNIPHTFQESAGIHDYNYWDRESITMLKFFDLLPENMGSVGT